jgi:hypothetical protein
MSDRWWDQIVQYAIEDAIIANYLVAVWESRGEVGRAAAMRETRDRKLGEFRAIPPPKGP